MYIHLQEILELIDTYPIQLCIDNEIRTVSDKSSVDKSYCHYEVIKLSFGTEPIALIEAKKYERMTDSNYSFETGV